MKTKNTNLYDGSSLEEMMLSFRRKMSDSLRQKADSLKCPISHFDTMIYIAEKGTPSMKEIANHLKITPPSTTSIIETLQKKKYIKRVSSQDDRRTIRVELTPQAWKFLKSLHEQKFEIFKNMLSKLSDEDKKQFIKILTILIKE